MVKVVEDAPSERAMQLELGGKIKPRSKVIPEVEQFWNRPSITLYISNDSVEIR